MLGLFMLFGVVKKIVASGARSNAEAGDAVG